jgi:hypothetical protein
VGSEIAAATVAIVEGESKARDLLAEVEVGKGVGIRDLRSALCQLHVQSPDGIFGEGLGVDNIGRIWT